MSDEIERYFAAPLDLDQLVLDQLAADLTEENNFTAGSSPGNTVDISTQHRRFAIHGQATTSGDIS